MNEGIVIVRGSMSGSPGAASSPWGFDVRHNGEVVGHTGSHQEAYAFARGFGAAIFAETGAVVSIEDHSGAAQ